MMSNDTSSSVPGSMRYLAALSVALLRSQTQAAQLPSIKDDNVWHMILEGAYEHRLTGFLYHYLHQPSWRNHASADFLLRAKRTYFEQWVRNGQLLRETARISKQLQSADIPHLFYKGPLFARQIYPHLGCRDTHDIDLMLLQASDVSEVERQLFALDYQRLSRIIAPMSLTQQFVYEFEYRNPEFYLDLHWTLHQHPSLKLDISQLWQTHDVVGAADINVATLSAEYTLLAFTLSLAPDVSNNALKLRAFLEIYLLLCKMNPVTNWQSFWNRRQQENTTIATQSAILAAANLFGTAEIEQITQSAISSEASRLSQSIVACLNQETNAWERKHVAFQLYEASTPISFGWWFLTLPIRVATHSSMS